MRNFQKKSGWRNIAESRPVLAFLGVLVLFFAWGVVGFMNKMIDTSRNKKIAEDKVAQLEQSKAKLSADINKLNTPAGKEESIREKFGLAKEGEGLIVVVDDKTEVATPPQNSGGFWGFFTRWFK